MKLKLKMGGGDVSELGVSELPILHNFQSWIIHKKKF